MRHQDTTGVPGRPSTALRIVPILLCATVLVLAATSAALAATARHAGPPTSAPSDRLTSDLAPAGYWLVATDGGIFAYGAAAFYGSAGDLVLNRPVVGMAATPDGGGYWTVASDGGVFAYGDAHFYGSTADQELNRPVVAMAATPDGGGYWLVASDGGVFAYGDARFHGSTGGLELNRPVVDMTPSPDGDGYWLAAADGGVFAFGDAGFHGSAGDLALTSPVRTVSATPSGHGYRMGAGDGGVFAYGDASFLGSAVGLVASASAVDLQPSPGGPGYWMAASNGGVFAFGDAPYFGSAGATHLNQPIVGMAVAVAPAVNPLDYGIGGDISTPLLPGTSRSVDLRITNPNAGPITVVSNSITVTTSTDACSPANFTASQGLRRPVTVPGGTTVTLGQLGVTEADWPVVGMLDTPTDQDACQGVHLTLHYTGQAIG